jgi:hypothetical protein
MDNASALGELTGSTTRKKTTAKRPRPIETSNFLAMSNLLFLDLRGRKNSSRGAGRGFLGLSFLW